MTHLNVTYVLVLFLVCSIMTNFGLVNAVYQTFPKTHVYPDNWTQDMKNVKMTTVERGLKIRIEFTNLDNQNYYTIPYIKIRIETNYEEQSNSKDWKYIELRNYAIPPNNTTSTYYDIDLHRSQTSIGRWSVRLTYVTNENSWDFISQIEPYPFEFKVASEDELQTAIKENPPSGFVFSPNITIEISVFGSLSIAITIVLLKFLRKKKGKGKFF